MRSGTSQHRGSSVKVTPGAAAFYSADCDAVFTTKNVYNSPFTSYRQGCSEPEDVSTAIEADKPVCAMSAYRPDSEQCYHETCCEEAGERPCTREQYLQDGKVTPVIFARNALPLCTPARLHTYQFRLQLTTVALTFDTLQGAPMPRASRRTSSTAEQMAARTTTRSRLPCFPNRLKAVTCRYTCAICRASGSTRSHTLLASSHFTSEGGSDRATHFGEGAFEYAGSAEKILLRSSLTGSIRS